MVQLREQRVAQTCPLCRKPLPPGPDKLVDLGWRIYAKIQAEVAPDLNGSWEHISLSLAQQEGMDQVRALVLEAAAQGHVDAQAICGNIYGLGRGVAKDERLAFVYNKKAAQQGHLLSQNNLAGNYLFGQGCEQSNDRAAKWYKKAAGQGHPHAMAVLGTLYHSGQGAPQSLKYAFELFQQSRALGNTDPHLQLNLGICYEHGHGVAKDYLEARRFYTMLSSQGFAPCTNYLSELEKKIRAECPLLGKRVVLTGTNREDLNGRTGMAISFDHDRARYAVEFSGNAGDDDKTGKLTIKPGNLGLSPEMTDCR